MDPTVDPTQDPNSDAVSAMLSNMISAQPSYDTSGATAPRPDIYSILQAAQGAPSSGPPLAQPNQQDLSMLGPGALLAFAAAVTQPRAYKQNDFGKILGAGSEAFNFYQQQKQLLQDRAIKQQQEQQAMALQQQQLQNAKLANVKATQDIVGTEEKRPLELQQLQANIEKATTDVQLNNLNLRLGAINEKYAEQLKQAALAESSAKTDEEKAKATQLRAQAEHFLQMANDAKTMLQMKLDAMRRPNLQPVGQALPGERQMLRDPQTGQTAYAPMSLSDAKALATRDAATQEQLDGKTMDSQTKAAYIKSKTLEYAAGTLPPPSGTPGTAPASAATPPASTGGSNASNDLLQRAAQASQTAGGAVVTVDGQQRYFIGGKEVDAKTWQSRNPQPTGGSSSTPAPAAAATPAPTVPAKPAPSGKPLAAYSVPAAAPTPEEQQRFKAAQAAKQLAVMQVTAARQVATQAIASGDRNAAAQAMQHPGFGALDAATQAALYHLANGS